MNITSNRFHIKNKQVHLFASRVIAELIVAGMKRLSCINWVQNDFVSNHHLKISNSYIHIFKNNAEFLYRQPHN